MQKSLLGDLSAAQFMRRHWQKSAHLVRQAVPGFPGVLSKAQLYALAARDDVESRLVIGGTGLAPANWTLEHGPFRRADFKALPARGWTLLVQGVDRHVDAAAALLERFAFIPYARLDDLMISFAAPGGGVGPHFDSYDVFLLQGPGTRRWRISQQRNLELMPDLPLKILRRFKADAGWDLVPGDMLYLPPSVAHDGVAVTECMTYSIGFRAPTSGELIDAFLHHLPEVLPQDTQRYVDAGAPATRNAGRIDPRMQRRMAAMLRAIRWDRRLIERFLGCMLSEPNADVFLEPPQPPLSRAGFVKAARHRNASGLRLDRRARMLYDEVNIYLNGEVLAARADHSVLAHLADLRRLSEVAAIPAATWHVLYTAYLTGALHAGTRPES